MGWAKDGVFWNLVLGALFLISVQIPYHRPTSDLHLAVSNSIGITAAIFHIVLAAINMSKKL